MTYLRGWEGALTCVRVISVFPDTLLEVVSAVCLCVREIASTLACVFIGTKTFTLD